MAGPRAGFLWRANGKVIGATSAMTRLAGTLAAYYVCCEEQTKANTLVCNKVTIVIYNVGNFQPFANCH